MSISNYEKEVLEIRNLLTKKQAEVAELESVYQQKIDHLQKLCEKEGHQFVADRDNDCHSSRMYYTCKRCDYFTRYKQIVC